MPEDKDDNQQKSNDNQTTELESQYILRLPPAAAAQLNAALKAGAMNMKDRLFVQLENDMRHGTVKFDDWVFPAKLMDLPTIVETHKTLDKKTFYKTADIGQILICKEEEDSAAQKAAEEEEAAKKKEKKDNKVDKRFLCPHGITLPLKNVRKRRFRKTLKKKYVDLPEIEKEVKRLFRMDNEAINVQYEVINADDEKLDQNKSGGLDFVAGTSGMVTNPQNLDVAEHEIFGEVSDSDEEHMLTLGYDDTSQSADNSQVLDKSDDKTDLLMFDNEIIDKMSNYSMSDDVKIEIIDKEKKKELLGKLDFLVQEINNIQSQREQFSLDISAMENQELKQRLQSQINDLNKLEMDHQAEYDSIVNIIRENNLET